MTWLGSHLAISNLYAYGRMAWDRTADHEAILRDWIRLTFGLDKAVIGTITQISMESWPADENDTGILGIQILTDIHPLHTLRAKPCLVRQQWLGSMDPCGIVEHRHGLDHREWHGLLRAIPSRGRENV